jgi:cytochrome P450
MSLTDFDRHDTTSNALSFALYFLAANPVSAITVCRRAAALAFHVKQMFLHIFYNL